MKPNIIKPEHNFDAPFTLDQLDIEAAERSLAEFSKQAWPIVEPKRVYQHNWHIDAICEHLEAVANGEIRNLLINVPPRHMKEIWHEQPILTPQGWRKHGDLNVGDFVFGPDGSHRKIIKKSEDSPSDVEVEFKNGEIIKCNGDHLWTVYDRQTKKWVTRDTRSFFNCKVVVGKKEPRCRFQLPLMEKLEFNKKSQPLDPYYVGLWIADGTRASTCITHHIDNVQLIDRIPYKVTSTIKVAKEHIVKSGFGHQGILEKLRDLGLRDKKYIPEIYKWGSVEQRLELLAGIIDGDGCVCKKTGRVRITSGDSEELARDIFDVVMSLGFYPTITTYKAPDFPPYKSKGTKCFVVQFTPHLDIPTVLPKKRVIGRNIKRRRIGIKEVRKAKNPGVGNCITVNHPDGLYLVGETCVPTHNSLLVSVFFPCWLWTTRPETRWLFSSYAQSLSSRDSVKCRRIIKHPWYQKRWGNQFQIAKDQDEKLKFENDRTGYRIASSVGGSNTGEGGDFILVDDPHKVNKTESAKERKNVISWWDNEMSTRGNDPDTYCKIVIMQRIHEGDLSGHILKQGGYEHLCLPAEYESKRKVWILDGDKKVQKEQDVKDLPTSIGWIDPRTEEEELLWPSRFTKLALVELKRRLGSRGTAGQLQQRPSPAKGIIVERHWWKFYPESPRDKIKQVSFITISWDMSFKKATDTDYVVGQVWGRTGANKFLFDEFRKKMGFVETIQAVLYMNAKWPQANENVVEEKANGSAVIDTLKSKIPGMIAYNPIESKESRIIAVSPQIEAGNVWLPDVEKYPWVEDYIEELAIFPNGEYDDRVDSTSQALLRLGKNMGWIEAAANMKDDKQKQLLKEMFWKNMK